MVWKKPWSLAKGFLIVTAIVVAGLVLQLSIGPVDWNLFRWPVNIYTLCLLLFFIADMALLEKQVYAFRFLSTYRAAVPALAFAAVLTVVMGFVRQEAHGTWFSGMLSFWPFVLVYTYIVVILGVVVIRQVRTVVAKHSYTLLFSSLLSHIGLFIALTTATLGNADMQRLRMVTEVGQPEWRAYDEELGMVELPITIELKQFIMDSFDDGTPRRFASEVDIYTQSQQHLHTTIDVNHPAEVEGWKIYQFGYDTQMGAMSRISIFELVRDPWLPFVYAGIFLMLAGAVGTFILAQRRSRP